MTGSAYFHQATLPCESVWLSDQPQPLVAQRINDNRHSSPLRALQGAQAGRCDNRPNGQKSSTNPTIYVANKDTHV